MKEPAITHDSARAIVREAIERVAPDVDAESIPNDVDIRVEAELDSMDFIAVVSTVKDRTGVDVAEADMSKATTIDGYAEHLVIHSTTPRSDASA